MPPRPEPTKLSCIESWTSSIGLVHLVKGVLLLAVFATLVRSIIVRSTQRKRRMESPEPEQEKKSDSQQPTPEKEANQYLQSIEQETREPSLGPIFPWTSPPQALPGPYDAPYYPLPTPTIRRKSHDSAVEEPQEEATTVEETATVPYSRRVSASSLPAQDSVLQGSTTVSTQGWRRTQWSVSAG